MPTVYRPFFKGKAVPHCRRGRFESALSLAGIHAARPTKAVHCLPAVATKKCHARAAFHSLSHAARTGLVNQDFCHFLKLMQRACLTEVSRGCHIGKS